MLCCSDRVEVTITLSGPLEFFFSLRAQSGKKFSCITSKYWSYTIFSLMHNYKPWGKIIYYNGFDKKHHSGMKYGIGLGGVEEGPRRHLQSNTQNHRTVSYHLYQITTKLWYLVVGFIYGKILCGLIWYLHRYFMLHWY